MADYFDKFAEFDDNFFSGRKPDLINKKVIKKFNCLIEAIPQSDDTETFYESCCIFYDDYISQNIILLILLFIFIMFLVYRYFMKEQIAELDNFNNIDNNKFDDKIDEYQNPAPIKDPTDCTHPIMRINDEDADDADSDTVDDPACPVSGISQDGYIITGNHSQDIQHRPTFNPFYPVSQQTSYVNYVANDVPLNVHGQYSTLRGDNLNDSVKYRYPANVNNEYSYYSGAYNTYEDVQDPILPNELGYIDDYNSTTEKAVRYMTDKNRRSLDTLASYTFE